MKFQLVLVMEVPVKFAKIAPLPVAPLNELLLKLYQRPVFLSCTANLMLSKPEPPASAAEPEKLMGDVTDASRAGKAIVVCGEMVSMLFVLKPELTGQVPLPK